LEEGRDEGAFAWNGGDGGLGVGELLGERREERPDACLEVGVGERGEERDCNDREKREE
jgi:hypothetical protein